MNRKKMLTLAAALALCLLAAVGGTLAWFTAQYRTTNVITTGSVEIRIVETTDRGGEEAPYEDLLDGVMPGTAVSKIVRIENLDADAWIRAQVAVTVTGADGEQLPAALADGTPVLDFTAGPGWTESDGYYYYESPVTAGGRTEPLFREVRFSEKLGNEYQGCTVRAAIQAGAVQAKNNAASSVLEVRGWPEITTP